MNELSHFDKEKKVTMVDVSGKRKTERKAVASAFVRMNRSTAKAIKNQKTPKGDPLEIARIAGILGAKKTSELIPLCHQIELSGIDLSAKMTDTGVYLEAEAVSTAKTGVEMEALTAVSVAALTIYDMCKAVQKDIVITDLSLKSKTGGKSDYFREKG